MPQYIFEANDEAGSRVSGELSAETVSVAIAELEGRGWTVHSIRLSTLNEEGSTSSAEARDQRHGNRRATTVEQQFVAAFEQRELLIPALAALAEELPSAQGRRELRRLVAVLRRCHSSAELQRNKIAAQWLPLLATGIDSESATRRLSELVACTSREAENRSNRRRLFAYPCFVAILAFAVLLFLCLFIVPGFRSMFEDFGLELLPPTLLIISISDSLRFHPLEFFVAITLMVGILYGLVRLWVHYSLSMRLFGFVIAGNSASLAAMSSLTGRLAELLSIDLPLADALWLAGQGCGHNYYRSLAERLARAVHQGGQPLRRSLAAHSFPANVIYALEPGQGGRPNLALLRELSVMYGDRAAQRVDWSSGAVAPMAIVILGLTVAFVVIALFAPLISLINGLS